MPNITALAAQTIACALGARRPENCSWLGHILPHPDAPTSTPARCRQRRLCYESLSCREPDLWARKQSSSERKPTHRRTRNCCRRVVGAPEVRAVEIRRAAIQVEVLCELQADPGVPGLVGKARRGERKVGEILDQAAAVRAADIAVVEGAEAGRRAKDVVARSEGRSCRAGDVEIAKFNTVGISNK